PRRLRHVVGEVLPVVCRFWRCRRAVAGCSGIETSVAVAVILVIEEEADLVSRRCLPRETDTLRTLEEIRVTGTTQVWREHPSVLRGVVEDACHLSRVAPATMRREEPELVRENGATQRAVVIPDVLHSIDRKLGEPARLQVVGQVRALHGV